MKKEAISMHVLLLSNEAEGSLSKRNRGKGDSQEERDNSKKTKFSSSILIATQLHDGGRGAMLGSTNSGGGPQPPPERDKVTHPKKTK